MKRLTLIAVLTLIACAASAGSASAAFELSDLDVSFLNADGTPATQAGSHPYEMQTTIAIETEETPRGGFPVGKSGT